MRLCSRLLDWRTWELPVKLLVDAVILFFSFLAALALRFDGDIPPESFRWFCTAFPFIAALYLSVNVLFRIYRRWWRYAGLPDAIALAEAVGLSTLGLFVVDLAAFPARDLPLSVVLVGGGIALMAMGVTKLRPRIRRRLLLPVLWPSSAARMLIVGAGRSGQMLAHELLQHREWQYRPVCFVDDDPKKQGLRIHGVRVMGTRHDIPALVAKHGVDVVAIAMSSAPGAEIRELVTISQTTNAKIQIVPGIPELIEGRVQSELLREVTVTDLLGRQMVEIDADRCRRCVEGKVVLVTGAAGSIGQELCRQLLALLPRAIVAVDNNESGLYELSVALAAARVEGVLQSCLADITDAEKLEPVFATHRPRVVFHAAAYKHVPLMEDHVAQAYNVNVVGTLNVCLAAERWGAERVTFISSDKAVRPSSVMGATKRVGELLIAELGRRGSASFCAVRFGNVLGSRGSVVPTFWRQIEAGGPVTVTHPDASRFFMTVSEAASLVIQAATFARSGEVFLLDMGEEIKIVDLAHKMIRLRGLRPGQDIAVVFTGLRPGEKLREELVADGEELCPTEHPKVLRVTSRHTANSGTLLSRVRQLAGQPERVSKQTLFALLEEEPQPIGSSRVGQP